MSDRREAAAWSASFRSAAASPATASGRPSTSSASRSRSSAPRCRPGTQVFDWTVPREWNIRGAWLDGPHGSASVDFADSNLHVLGYSVPVARAPDPRRAARPPLLRPRAAGRRSRTAPRTTTRTGASASRTSWLERLPDGEYEAVIDSTLEDGSLTYAEHVVPGESEDEVLLSTYVCHPSLANDNLSGIVLLTDAREAPRGPSAALHVPLPVQPGDDRPDHLALAERGAARPRQARPRRVLRRRPGAADLQAQPPRRRGDRPRRRARGAGARRTRSATGRRSAATSGSSARRGSTSRSACSRERPRTSSPATTPRPTTSSSSGRSTSQDSLEAYLEVLEILENGARAGNATYVNTNPKGEPQLGKRGLYRADRRRVVRRGPAALGAEPLGRRARPARDRRALGPPVRRDPHRGRLARGARPAGRGQHFVSQVKSAARAAIARRLTGPGIAQTALLAPPCQRSGR